MNPESLGLRTDLIFDRFSGEVIDRGDYLVVRTPSRPTYYWGNYLVLRNPPREGDCEKWIALFDEEIGPHEERGFMALSWDRTAGDAGVIEPFVERCFDVLRTKILTASAVHPAPKFDPAMIVRPLQSEADWNRHVDIQFRPDWKYGSDEGQRNFLAEGRDELRAMAEAGHGLRFGAEIDGVLVGEAGLYWDGEIGRFNNVATHREFRRRGVCSTLVYRMAQWGLNEKGLTTLVMEADEDYHAGAIYESIGFVPKERLVKLEWRVRGGA